MEGFPRSLFADMMPQNRARIAGSKFIKCLFCSNQGLLVPPRGKATQQVTRITAFPDTPRWGATTRGNSSQVLLPITGQCECRHIHTCIYTYVYICIFIYIYVYVCTYIYYMYMILYV